MSLNDKLKKLRSDTLRPLIRLGFKEWERIISHYRRSILPLRKETEINEYSWVISKIRNKKTMNIVTLCTKESLTLKKLRDEVYEKFTSKYWSYLDNFGISQGRSPVNKTFEHHVLCSVKATPQARIMSAMPHVSWNPELGCYTQEIDWKTEKKSTEIKQRPWN